MTTTSTLAELLRETEPYTQDDAHWFEESAKRLEEQELAINQLTNKVAELTRDSLAFHDFFYKHDPMGYQAFYARNVS